MENSFFRKHYGFIFAFIYPFIGFMFSYGIWPGFTYNGLSVFINIVCLATLMAIVIILTKTFYSVRPKTILAAYTLSVFLVLNFSLSSLADWVNHSESFDSDARGMSFVIVLPLSFSTCVIWGILFDRLKNKIALSKI